METWSVTNSDYSRKYGYILSLVILMICCGSDFISAQSPVKIYPSFGISVGFFNPKDVNDYIKDDLSQINISETYGSTSMFMYYELQGGITLKMKRFDINGIVQYAIAPKWIVVLNGDSKDYYFSRTSLGVTADFYIPLGSSEKKSLFFGGGPIYHFMSFESYKASAPGIKLQGGISFQFGKFNLQPYLAFNYAKALNKDYDFDLNYTGGQIGVIFSFHKK
jgi:hypothetical protein